MSRENHDSAATGEDVTEEFKSTQSSGPDPDQPNLDQPTEQLPAQQPPAPEQSTGPTLAGTPPLSPQARINTEEISPLDWQQNNKQPPPAPLPTQNWQPKLQTPEGIRQAFAAGQVRVGLLIWAAVLIVIGLLVLFIATTGAVGFQAALVSLLTATGVSFIALAFFMSRKTAENTIPAQQNERV